MSMHKIPLTELEHDGLLAHRLPIGVPSQLSDVFRSGIKWANEHRIAELQAKAVPEGMALVSVAASPAVLDRAVSFALNVSLSREYTWSDYMRDLWAQMIADHIPGATKMVVSQADPAPAASPVVPEWKILGCVSEVTSPDRAVIALQNSFPNLQVGDIVKLHPAAYGSIPSADLIGGDEK